MPRYLEVEEMKNKICIAIAILSILISCCLVSVGCTPLPGYIAIDSRSALMKPTFYVSDDPYFRKRLRISSIKVEKLLRSSKEKKPWELHAPLNSSQTVWELELEYSDTFILALLQSLLRPTASSLMYGEVPWGYQEKVKALPLEPEELYILSMNTAYGYRETAPLRFIIRLNDTGAPDRIEYRLGISSPWDDIFDRMRSYLKLY